MLPVAAVLALAVGLFLYRNATAVQAPAPQVAQTPAVPADDESAQDQQVIQVVADNKPAQREQYTQNLRSVNAYIRDAKASLQQNPDDNDAKEYLMQAYGQKAMLYQMAARTGE